jgi:mRNA-degrading endonuclease RelE of RelBE toxin-antitoxin system
MDKIEKALNKLGSDERKKLKKILIQIDRKDFQNLDLKKLKGRNDVFRVRKGNIRIIFYKTDNPIKILSIERRSSKTYNKIRNK